MQVLVTGGTGFIGAHACVELLRAGHAVVILDNLSNSRREVVAAIAEITGTDAVFIEGDIRDQALLERIIERYNIDALMHFAALKSPAASQLQPLAYYDTNVTGTLAVLDAVLRRGVRAVVFSSSAAVYGNADACPIAETTPIRPLHPYGHSKWMCEQILADLIAATPSLCAAVLRYFNPAGAHPSGLIAGEYVSAGGNLFSNLCAVASANQAYLQVFGNRYSTADGTGVRDYLHVQDVARAHVLALEFIVAQQRSVTLNLGSGTGLSVHDVVQVFERVSGRNIPLQHCPPRPGDVAMSYADPKLAWAQLGWRARLGIEQICADAWHGWQYAKRIEARGIAVAGQTRVAQGVPA